MIGYLRGKIISKKPTEILIDVAGVGYVVNISLSTFDKIPEIGKEVEIFTYLHVKENEFSLFGFSELEEKNIFTLLIGVSGIGPKLALSVLSGISSTELISAIRTQDIIRLKSIHGIGKKTAERLILELKDKVGGIIEDTEEISTETHTIKSDAVAALVSLGFTLKKAEILVSGISKEYPTIRLEDLIKEALKRANG